MERYANRSGTSSIVGFEFGTEWIRVHFEDGSAYNYSYGRAGRSNVERMKSLALGGEGLNRFIHANVKHAYDR